jgi:hypothetical protein
MIYTAESIAGLVRCAKTLRRRSARDFKEQNRHRSKNMELVSAADPERRFSVFFRQSLEFPEDFSCGLDFDGPDGKRVTLVRYNGQHEQSDNPLHRDNPHFRYHINRATPENLNQGRLEKHPATIQSSYASFEQAVAVS